MNKSIDQIMSSLIMVKQQVQKLNSLVSTMQHGDAAVMNYMNRVKKLSLQSMDLFNEMSRQVSFLNNECRNSEIREKTRSKK